MKLLLADENFSFPVVEHLRAKGHDVVTIKELGRSGEGFPDDAVLALAVSLERAVLTFNRKDFKALHRKSSEHKGIIMCTYNPDFPNLLKLFTTQLASILRCKEKSLEFTGHKNA